MSRRIYDEFCRVTDAGAALLICGFGGFALGALATLTIAVLFVGPGAIYAAEWGGLSGFCAATCGAALGGRKGWKISGAFWGTYGGYNLVLVLNRTPVGAAAITSGLIALLIMAAPSVMGCLLGDFVAGAFESHRLLSSPKASAAGLSGLLLFDSLPLPLRLWLAISQLLPVLACIPDAVASQLPLWFRYWK